MRRPISFAQCTNSVAISYAQVLLEFAFLSKCSPPSVWMIAPEGGRLFRYGYSFVDSLFSGHSAKPPFPPRFPLPNRQSPPCSFSAFVAHSFTDYAFLCDDHKFPLSLLPSVSSSPFPHTLSADIHHISPYTVVPPIQSRLRLSRLSSAYHSATAVGIKINIAQMRIKSK